MNSPSLPDLKGCHRAERRLEEQQSRVWTSFYLKGREHLGPATGRAAALQWLWQADQKEPDTLHEAQVLFNKVAKEVGNAALRARTARM